jgi:hypothetical protein
MKSNLASLRSEIEEYLRSHDVAIFHSAHHMDPHFSAAYWDVAGHPDFRTFLATAEAAGVRLVALFAHEFRDETIDDAAELLEESDLGRDDRRAVEQRLREFGTYTGFVCEIEVSFDLGSRAYIFDLRTDWYDEFSEILDRIEGDLGEEENDQPLGGPYFSKN